MIEQIECTFQEAVYLCKKGGGSIRRGDIGKSKKHYFNASLNKFEDEKRSCLELFGNDFDRVWIYEPPKKSSFKEWNAKHCCTIPVGERGLNTHRREGWNGHHEAVEKLFNVSRTVDGYGNIFVSLKKHEFDKLKEL